MKPRFALNLSHDGIGLLHRAKRGWNLVGEASLDDPDLTKTLHMLRETASALEAGGVRSKLVIPDSQILYTALPAAANGDATDAYIRAGLEGLTPYDVTDLVFDWSKDGDQIRLAVVARETLDEAEAFATEHRFNPVSFVARPQDDQFPGEPFFGQTAQAATLLSADDALEQDDQPIAIHGRTSLPREAADAPAPATGMAAPAAMALSAADLVAPPPETPPTAEPAPEPAPPETGVAAAEEPEVEVPASAEPETEAPASEAPDAEAPVMFETKPETAPPAPDLAIGLAPGSAAEIALAEALSDPEAPPAPATHDIPAELAGLPLPTEPDGAAAPGMLDVLASKSERLQALETGIEPTPPDTAVPMTPRPVIAARAQQFAATMPAPTPDRDAAVTGGPAAGAAATGRSGVLGWVLAMIVLLIAAAALWAMLGMGQETAQAPADITQIQTTALTPQRPDTPALPGDPAGQGPKVLQNAPAEAPGAPLLAALPTDADLPTRIALPDADLAAPTSAAEPEVAPQADAATAPAAQPGEADPTERTGTELAALDLGQITSDLAEPPALPDTERAFDPPLPDPVTPTAEGALSYRGVLVFAGRPPVEVPPRPQAATGTDAPASGTPPAETAPEQPDPHLAQYRPNARPRTQEDPAAAIADTPPVDTATEPETPAETATDPAETPDSQTQNLGGINWAALQQFRPQSRPGAAVATAPVAQPEAASFVPAGPVSELALARSQTPVARPRNFSQAVQRALKQVQPEAPVAQAVPASAALTPRNPTVKSVANQATEANAIRLNRLNLIGVYGSTSDRRALVRLPSGRYVKLKIGDRLDGGKVAAISERELRYVKSGKNIVLSMPQG